MNPDDYLVLMDRVVFVVMVAVGAVVVALLALGVIA